METIANEMEAAMNAAQETAPPGGGDPYALIAITCAPGYRGHEERIRIPRMWQSVAEDLVAAGGRRHFWSRSRDDAGLDRLYATWDEIREIWNGPAYDAGIPVTTAAELVGVSRAAMYNILNNKRGKQKSTAHVQDTTTGEVMELTD